MPQDYEVVVVGGGPVGVMALALLGHAGISAVGIEREATLWPQARAVHFDGETMRAFQTVGLGEDVFALCKPMLDFRMENEAGETLMAFPTGQWGSQAWHDDLMFHQPEVDSLLRAEVERLPGVELRPGTTLQEIEQDGSTVTLPRRHRRRRIDDHHRALGHRGRRRYLDRPSPARDRQRESRHRRSVAGRRRPPARRAGSRRRHDLPRPPHPAGPVGPAPR